MVRGPLGRLASALQNKFGDAATLTQTGPALAVLQSVSRVLQQAEYGNATLSQVCSSRYAIP